MIIIILIVNYTFLIIIIIIIYLTLKMFIYMNNNLLFIEIKKLLLSYPIKKTYNHNIINLMDIKINNK